jgi:hypothetical protein
MAQLYKLNNVPSMKESDIFELLQEAIDIVVQLEKTPEGVASSRSITSEQAIPSELTKVAITCLILLP